MDTRDLCCLLWQSRTEGWTLPETTQQFKVELSGRLTPGGIFVWREKTVLLAEWDGSWLGKGIAPLSPRHVSVLYVLHLHPGPTVTEVEGKGGPEMASLSSSVVPVSFISTRESLLDTGVGGEGASDRQRSKLSLSHSKIPAAKIYPELYLPAFFSLAGTSSVLRPAALAPPHTGKKCRWSGLTPALLNQKFWSGALQLAF